MTSSNRLKSVVSERPIWSPHYTIPTFLGGVILIILQYGFLESYWTSNGWFYGLLAILAALFTSAVGFSIEWISKKLYEVTTPASSHE